MYTSVGQSRCGVAQLSLSFSLYYSFNWWTYYFPSVWSSMPKQDNLDSLSIRIIPLWPWSRLKRLDQAGSHQWWRAWRIHIIRGSLFRFVLSIGSDRSRCFYVGLLERWIVGVLHCVADLILLDVIQFGHSVIGIYGGLRIFCSWLPFPNSLLCFFLWFYWNLPALHGWPSAAWFSQLIAPKSGSLLPGLVGVWSSSSFPIRSSIFSLIQSLDVASVGPNSIWLIFVQILSRPLSYHVRQSENHSHAQYTHLCFPLFLCDPNSAN